MRIPFDVAIPDREPTKENMHIRPTRPPYNVQANLTATATEQEHEPGKNKNTFSKVAHVQSKSDRQLATEQDTSLAQSDIKFGKEKISARQRTDVPWQTRQGHPPMNIKSKTT